MNRWNVPKTPEFLTKIGNMSQIAGLKRYKFTEGKAQGVEAIDVRTGSGLEFTVLPGRGMDLAWASFQGIPLNYISKTGIVSPSYYESNGMNWLHSFFAGMLTTCGLLNVGEPVTTHHAVVGERQLGLHGRISNCAADQVCTFEDWEDAQYQMRMSGRMQEAALHCESLSMRREITTSLFSHEFVLRDTIVNRGTTPQPLMLLYHINFGFPLLDENSRVLIASKDIRPLSEFAKQDLSSVKACHAPVRQLPEQCYLHDMATDTNGMVSAALVNDALGLGLAISYAKDALPYFNQWKMLSEQEYAIGLEPGNCYPTGLDDALANNHLDILQPSEQKHVEIRFQILDGADAIHNFEVELAART